MLILCLWTGKWFQVLLLNTNYYIESYLFSCTESYAFRYCYVLRIIQFRPTVKYFKDFLSVLMILLNISHSFAHSLIVESICYAILPSFSYIYIYIYIYIQRRRERESQRQWQRGTVTERERQTDRRTDREENHMILPIQEATSHKTAAVPVITSHLTNHPTNTKKIIQGIAGNARTNS